MPLTAAQLIAIDRKINGWTEIVGEEEVYHRGLNDIVNDIIIFREDVLALARIHGGFGDENCTTTLTGSLSEGRTLSHELDALLT